ncbi:hypothetical protein ECZU26_20330 [Escherichia coli]|nr:hypothetical protein ECZU26_20330 [Escherichia coli]
MLALQLAAQIAGGPDLLEVGELPTGPVIYLPAEDPPTAIHHRLHALGAHLSAEERQARPAEPLIGSLPNIMAPEWFDGLKRAAEGRRLMVLDTLRRFHIEEETPAAPWPGHRSHGGHRRRYRVLYRVPAPCQQGRGHDGRRRPAAVGTGR